MPRLLSALVRKGGSLIVAGFTIDEKPLVLEAFDSAFTLSESAEEDDWWALVVTQELSRGSGLGARGSGLGARASLTYSVQRSQASISSRSRWRLDSTYPISIPRSASRGSLPTKRIICVKVLRLGQARSSACSTVVATNGGRAWKRRGATASKCRCSSRCRPGGRPSISRWFRPCSRARRWTTSSATARWLASLRFSPSSPRGLPSRRR